MQRILTVIAVIGVLLILGAFMVYAYISYIVYTKLPAQSNTNTSMILTSSAFASNESIPKEFTCDGQDISPELFIHDVPPEAKSLTLIMDDPDAPMGTFTHWLIWNINPKINAIKEGGGKPPGSVEGKNSAGKIGYIGPCPPSGTHHYHFKLYALRDKPNLPSGATKQELENVIKNSLIAETELIGTYNRK